MSAIRTAVGLLGVATFGLAVATVLVPDLAAALDVTAWAANDYLVIVPLGLAAVLVVLGVLASRSIRGVDQATPPDPERVPTADHPGADFDRLVDGGLVTALAAHRRRDALRERLREAAFRTTMRGQQCTHRAARRAVDDGTWTDDRVAADFLADDPPSGGPTPTTTVTALLARELPLQRRARQTALAIERAGRGDPV